MAESHLSISNPSPHPPIPPSDEFPTSCQGASEPEVVHHAEPVSYHQHEWSPNEKTAHILDSESRRPVRVICGTTPWLFWGMILLITMILAAGIGAGIGVGLSNKRSNEQGTSSPTITNDPAPRPTSSPSANSPPEDLSSSASKAASSLDVSCPANDTLLYTPPYLASPEKQSAYRINDTTLSYTIHCNRTYFPSDDIEDVQYIPASNLSACIQACSMYSIQMPNGGGAYGFYVLCSGLTVTGAGVCQLKTWVHNGAEGVNRTEEGDDGMSAILLW